MVVRNHSLRRGLEADGRAGEAEAPNLRSELVEAWFYRNLDKPLPFTPIGQLARCQLSRGEPRSSLRSDG